MRNWAESKQMPGQFVGTTGAKVLTPAELSSGYQAWARKVTTLNSSLIIFHPFSFTIFVHHNITHSHLSSIIHHPTTIIDIKRRTM